MLSSPCWLWCCKIILLASPMLSTVVESCVSLCVMHVFACIAGLQPRLRSECWIKSEQFQRMGKSESTVCALVCACVCWVPWMLCLECLCAMFCAALFLVLSVSLYPPATIQCLCAMFCVSAVCLFALRHCPLCWSHQCCYYYYSLCLLAICPLKPPKWLGFTPNFLISSCPTTAFDIYEVYPSDHYFHQKQAIPACNNDYL